MAVALVVPTLMATLGTRADACSCTPLTVKVWPDAKTHAPLNTHIFIFIPRNLRQADPFLVGTEVLPPADAVLRLKGRNLPVEVARLELGAGDESILELVPLYDLSERSTYQVDVRDGGQHHLFEIHTGVDRIVEPPVWRQTPSSRYTHAAAACCMCQTGEPQVRLTPADHEAPFLYAIWSRGDGAAVNYATPPVTYVATSYPSLGHPTTCLPRNFVLEPGQLKLGVRLMDLAGNLSSPVEFLFDDVPADGRATDTALIPLPAGFVPYGALVADIEAAVIPRDHAADVPRARVPTFTNADLAEAHIEAAPAPAGVSMRHAVALFHTYGKVLLNPPPAVIKQVTPDYPEAARRRGIGGTVIVQAVAGPDGKLEGVEVRRSAHSLLDAPAREAVSRWELAPFTSPGQDHERTTAALSVAITFAPPQGVAK